MVCLLLGVLVAALLLLAKALVRGLVGQEVVDLLQEARGLDLMFLCQFFAREEAVDCLFVILKCPCGMVLVVVWVLPLLLPAAVSCIWARALDHPMTLPLHQHYHLLHCHRSKTALP